MGLVWFTVRTMLAAPALVLEKLGPFVALKRGWLLSRGAFWRLLGLYILTNIIVQVVTGVLSVPLSFGLAVVMFSTTSILAPVLSPSVVGQLIALYEHITFVEGIVWGLDSFDQWGVELGKKLALEIAPAVFGDAEALAKQDPSTQSLVSWYLEKRD